MGNVPGSQGEARLNLASTSSSTGLDWAGWGGVGQSWTGLRGVKKIRGPNASG